MVVINVEKIHDKVLKRILIWALIKKGIPKMHVNVI